MHIITSPFWLKSRLCQPFDSSYSLFNDVIGSITFGCKVMGKRGVMRRPAAAPAFLNVEALSAHDAYIRARVACGEGYTVIAHKMLADMGLHVKFSTMRSYLRRLSGETGRGTMKGKGWVGRSAANGRLACASPKIPRRPTCPRESMEKTVASLRTHSLAHSLNRLHASRPSVPMSSVARREVTRRRAAL